MQYFASGALEPVISANELRIPIGAPVEFTLTSPDVIHSFWIPSLGGKLDMIPGRLNRFVLSAGQIGTFRGECAVFCGTSHALTAFAVEAMEPAGFDTWLAGQAQPASPPATPGERFALATFMEVRCDACHAIRGPRRAVKSAPT